MNRDYALVGGVFAVAVLMTIIVSVVMLAL
jgi:uncharacterized protein (UPF0303 family)